MFKYLVSFKSWIFFTSAINNGHPGTIREPNISHAKLEQGKQKEPQFGQTKSTTTTTTTTTAATMATPWEVAKEILQQDFCAGMLPRTLGPTEVYEMRREYQAVEYGKFRTNLNKLRRKLEFQQSSAASDNAALQHYMGLNPVNMNPAGGMKYPRRDLSDAQRLLKEDITAKRHKAMQSQELHMTQLGYQRFPKDVFRKHIHQEVRSLTETPYWLVTKMKKQEQKDKKKATKLREAEIACLENTN
jgi:hypothetical protein